MTQAVPTPDRAATQPRQIGPAAAGDGARDAGRPRSFGLSVQGVTRSFGATRALDAVSLDVAPGEFVSIIGPSGCGKSTLLRAIAGLERVDEGAVLIGGEDVRPLAPAAREVAFVFQSYALYPHLTCRENLEAPLAMRELSALGRAPLLHHLSPGARRTRASIAARVARIAAQLQIEGLLDRRPGQLSGGQRQRVALGRALIREPKLFLLDEPLANLDAALRNTTRAELHALQRRVGATTLFVTHDQAEAMAISDRIAVMFAGRLRQIGTPDELYRHPADLGVARFLSQPWLNVIPAEVLARALATGLGAGMGQVRDAGLRRPGSVVAFRPEHATIHRPREHAQGIAVEVVRAEHAGADANLFVRLSGEGTEALQCVVRIASAEIMSLQPGTRAVLRFDPDAAWVFAGDDEGTAGAADPATAQGRVHVA